MSKKLDLFKRILTLGVLVAIVLFVVRWCSSRGENLDELTIENTPIRVELVRNLAEIATIRLNDEVVVDSVEYYKSMDEQLSGNLTKLLDPANLKYGVSVSAIKRRLTLIVKAELSYGFDLKKQKIEIQETDSTVRIVLPSPQILDVAISPSTTEIYQENGKWRDYEVSHLRQKARIKVIRGSNEIDLETMAKTALENLLKKMIPNTQGREIGFEYR